MLAKVAGFEFRYQLKNPVFWVAAAIFFLFSYGYVASDIVQLGGGGNVHENSPFLLVQVELVFSVFYMFVSTAFVANIIIRDDDTGFGPIVRSTRINKFDYLLGRFAGAFLVAALAFLAIPLGILIGSFMPWLDQETLGPNRLAHHAFAYLAIALPNIFITCALFFALATATRSMMTTYLGVIGFLILWFLIRLSLRDQPQLEHLNALLDPFGGSAYGQATRYWTAAERNTLIPAFDGLLLLNRLVWAGVGMASLALAYWAYRFTDKGTSKRQRKKQALAEQADAGDTSPRAAGAPLPRAGRGSRVAWSQFKARAALEMKQVFKSPAFTVLIALGLFNSIASLWFGGDLFGTPSLPVTRGVVPILAGSFGIIPIIIATYYAGELVWRERERKMHEIVDATPLPNWAYVVPKTLAVSLVLLTTLAISVAAAVLVQALKGYYDFEFGKYLLWYVLPEGYDIILFAILAVFVQALSPNKYVGWGIMVLYVVFQSIAQGVGLEHNLYNYGQGPNIQYSDLNGAGSYWKGAWWFRLYWGAFAAILLVLAHLLWRRGTETRLVPRLRRMPARLWGAPGLIAALALLVMAPTGIWIFYNTNVLNDYRTRDEGDKYAAAFEKKYLAYEKLPQPAISDVRLDVSLYPDEQRAEVKGRYQLTNLTDRPIRDVHIRLGDRVLELRSLDFPGARLVSEDKQYRYRIYRLDRPMAPGEKRALSFETRRWQRGFRNEGGDTRMVGNGTFLNNFELAPVIGMDRNGLLSERTKRRKYGLPPELRPAKLEDMSATGKSYFGGGWTTAEINISTSADQTPIAPGKKLSDVTRNGRRTARFVSDAPILTFFSIQSARYAEKHRLYRGIDLGIYYHPAHSWNVDRMLNALQAGLDYYQANFGPYQFDQARIIEFPGYAQFAQAFANTMPYSEAIGFTADIRNPDKIDYVTYVTAHELGHQYWAHQIIGADMQGGTMLSETLAQYSALMVMKHLYGEDKIRRFLKFELDRYLRSRGGEAIEELPLGRVEDQQYIHYAKGSLVMYLLQERLGEDRVNRALRTVLNRYKFKGAPYPRSLDLIQAFRAEATNPEEQALITDLFERITVYDLKTSGPTAVRRADGKWDVTVPVEARKFYADGKGVERPAGLNERIEIGLFTAEPGLGKFDRRNVIVMERRPLRTGKQVLRFVTDKRPTHAGVDPYNFYVDRNSGDNVAPVG
jgi:ABC-2 type transport system permease protein